MINKIKGTEDILPQDIHLWHFVEDTARTIFETYNFKEIRTPVFESFDLFSRSVGDTTDIVSKEMYEFYDKGERHIALRPEGTAPVVRSYVENKLFGPEHPHPLKVYYDGPMFRYERPQTGRQRQFHQIGVEVFDSSNPATDAEAIAMAWDFLTELGVENLTIYINSLGKPEERQAYRTALVAYFEPLESQLSDDSKRRLHENPLRILDSKDEADKKLVKDAPVILDFLGEESNQNFEAVQTMLTDLNIPYEVDPLIVRGLDYYQDTIFEIIVDDTTIGAQSTVAGGGRYDGLTEQLDGPHAPGFGFAIGIERLLLLMQAQNVELPEEPGLDLFIIVVNDQANSFALQIAQLARQAGLITDRDFLGRSIKSQFKTASKNKAKVVATIGDQEVETKEIQFKNQESGKQTTISLTELEKDFFAVYRQLTMDTNVVDDFFKGEF